MKALTIRQPYAQLVALGLKPWESRTWATSYRGPLVIHAAAGWSLSQREDAARFFAHFSGRTGVGEEEREELLLALGLAPVGAAVAVVDLVGCEEVTPVFLGRLSESDRMTGWWDRARFAWRFENPRQVEPAVPMRGKLNLWEVGEEHAAALRGQVSASRGQPVKAAGRIG